MHEKDTQRTNSGQKQLHYWNDWFDSEIKLAFDILECSSLNNLQIPSNPDERLIGSIVLT